MNALFVLHSSETMSNSYRTQKESLAAARRIKRDADGKPIFPRIIAKQPTVGDVHPLTKSNLQRLFDRIPIEYLYGLRRIELKPRLNDDVGNPFALYSPSEKTIKLFSLPIEWKLKHLSDSLRFSLEKFHAIIIEENEFIIVRWRDVAIMSLWFYCNVFAHELGHHFKTQYYHKNGGFGSYRHQEFVAELHAKRFTDALLRKSENKTQVISNEP